MEDSGGRIYQHSSTPLQYSTTPLSPWRNFSVMSQRSMFLSEARIFYLWTNQQQLYSNFMRQEIETLHKRTTIAKLQRVRNRGRYKIMSALYVSRRGTNVQPRNILSCNCRTQNLTISLRLYNGHTTDCIDPLSELHQCLSPNSDSPNQRQGR